MAEGRRGETANVCNRNGKQGERDGVELSAAQTRVVGEQERHA